MSRCPDVPKARLDGRLGVTDVRVEVLFQVPPAASSVTVAVMSAEDPAADRDSWMQSLS
jgi:hypothetical protein